MRKAMIDTHIQSYFFVMEKEIIDSPVFKEYWDHVEYHMRLDDVVEHEETEMTTFFANRGFHNGVFLLESDLLMERTRNTAPYGHPSSLLLLGSPFVKKKSFRFMSPGEEITLKAMIKQIANEN